MGSLEEDIFKFTIKWVIPMSISIYVYVKESFNFLIFLNFVGWYY